MRVDETPAGDASGREYPRAEQNRQRPIDISELHDGPGLPCVGVILLSPDVAGNGCPVMPAWGYPPAGVANPAGPMARCCRRPRWPV